MLKCARGRGAQRTTPLQRAGLNVRGNLGEPSIGDGIVVFAPGFEAAFQRANARNALFSEEERHTGARSFVWSSAVEDDFAIAG
jgi:hypothetical protein